jgi:hypothetical protein
MFISPDLFSGENSEESRKKENGCISKSLSDFPLSGHFAVEIGRAMEDSFIDLLYRLGYTVFKGRDFGTGLDIIGKFYSHPINPKLPNSCTLLPPSFSPTGTTAFSVKRGNFRKKDVTELVEKVREATTKENETLRSIEGMVIVTNFTRAEKDLDELKQKNVYCWDGRRLIFYSAKAQAVQELSNRSEVEEIAIEGVNRSSYLIARETDPSKIRNVILASIVVFIDDHDKTLIIGADHIETILTYIYNKSLRQIVDSAKMDVQVSLKIHALGIVSEKIVKESYPAYANDQTKHPRVFFPADFLVFQYGSAPWAIIYSTDSVLEKRVRA